MSWLPHTRKPDIEQFANTSGGVNLNDPATGLKASELRESLNSILLGEGWKRWPGCENVTAKGAITDHMRGQWSHSEVDGAEHLYESHGGKLYEVNRTTGALTELYDMTGDGQVWGGSHWGTFFAANGSSVVKIEGSTAYKVGIAPPTGATSALQSGGTLTDGEWQIYLTHSRQSAGLDLLYSTGQSVTSRTCGAGDNTIRITFSDVSASDAQVTHVNVWMAGPNDGGTFYWYGEAGIDAGTVDISTEANKETGLTYGAYAQSNIRPNNFTFLFCHDNRIWGVINNRVYYSLKAGTKYDLECFPALNYIDYPYRVTGLFAVGRHICVNTERNGVIIQPNADVEARYEHYEKQTQFKWMQTVADWNGNKIGVTHDRVGVFNAETLKFEDWDYGWNIRPVLDRMWANTDSNHQPCGIVHRRSNRIEYMLSLMDTDVNESNNNRTWILNLSKTFFVDKDSYVTPWEMLGRGFNYVCEDSNDTLYFGQSFAASSTIYKELGAHTTEVGIYGDDGLYKDTAANMTMRVKTRTVTGKTLWTRTIMEGARGLIQISDAGTLTLAFLDDPDKTMEQETDIDTHGQSLWDAFNWADDDGVGGTWSAESLRLYEFKGDLGLHGYHWYAKFEQTADDINMQISKFDVGVSIETGSQV